MDKNSVKCISISGMNTMTVMQTKQETRVLGFEVFFDAP